MTSAQKNMRGQAGFTLVELAIVMIIIGLLIAGVLKGQQLIGNAKVTAQVAQVKAIDAATSTFRDMYSSLPGDMGPFATNNPANRLPNCAAGTACDSAAGANGDGVLGTVLAPEAPGAAHGAGTESSAFFPQLNAAALLTGLNPNLGIGVWGGFYPAAKINGGLNLGYTPGNVALTLNAEAPASIRGGTYLVLTDTAAAAATATTLSPNEGQRIDTKLDDGVATSGSVFAIGAAANCWIAASGQYNELNAAKLCGLYIQIQN